MDTPELNDYRAHLLDALDDQPQRAAEERPGFLQVLVNHERVGTLNCSQVLSDLPARPKTAALHLEIRAVRVLLWLRAAEAGQKIRLPIGKRQPGPQHPNHFRRRLTPLAI